MPRYNSNAGFKSYDIDDDLQESEVIASPLSKYKSWIIIGGVSVGVVLVLVLVIMLLIPHEKPNAAPIEHDEEETISETFDYNALFGVETTDSEEEEITIPNPYATKPTVQIKTQPNTIAPQKPRVQPTTAPQKPAASPSNNNSSTNQSNSSNITNNNSNNNTPANSGGGNSQTPVTPSPPPSNRPSTISVSSISVSKNNVTLTQGKSETITASVSPSNATNKTITWSSSNNSIATVTNGKIVAVGVGSAKIYASAHNGQKAECTVVVRAKPVAKDNIKISPTEKTISINHSVIIELTGTTEKITWEYSNPFVVEKVRAYGNKIVIKGSKKGMCNVEAVLPNGKRYKCKITVK